MLSDAYPPLLGGTEVHVQSLSRNLSKRGHQVSVYTIWERDLSRYEEEAGIKIHRLEGFFQKIPCLFKNPARKGHPPAQDWLISKRLAQIIERESPDIIHAHGWILYSVLPLKKDARIPIVHTLHDYRLLCPKMTLMKKNAICDDVPNKGCILCLRHPYGLLKALPAYYGVRINRNKLRFVDKFIALSTLLKEVHVKHLGIGDKQMVVIPNFYDPDMGTGGKDAEGLPDEFILFVGRLSPHKGVDLLIEAYQKQNTEVKLLVVGIEDMNYHYQSTGNILVVKNVSHDVVVQAMSKCKFAIFPSIGPDPYPTVALEAMSQRKAIIASDVGGLKEMVVDGKTGILVYPNDSDKLAEALAHLLQRPGLAAEMGEKGYERFIENYIPDVVIPRIIGVYEGLI